MLPLDIDLMYIYIYTDEPRVSAGNKFQDIPRLRETADNTEGCV
jgi:hypothetical protein